MALLAPSENEINIPMKSIATLAACGLAVATVHPTLRADTFGSGANTFTIDFVNVGNAGNTDDAGAGGGIYSSPYGGVSYNYRIGTYEITQDAITKATNLGLTNVTAGAWTGSQPAANMTWYEAAAFVNFLNTSTGHQAAYQIDAGGTALTLWSSGEAWQAGGENLYRHKEAYYFLPSEDEWYKAAFHKNNGCRLTIGTIRQGATASRTASTSAVIQHSRRCLTKVLTKAFQTQRRTSVCRVRMEPSGRAEM